MNVAEGFRKFKVYRVAHPGFAIIQTRLVISLAVMALALTDILGSLDTKAFRAPWPVLGVLLAYLIFSAALAKMLARIHGRLKRLRASLLILDLAAISVLVVVSGGETSLWFLAYFFPILSASRYLDTPWTVGIASLSAAGYCVAALAAGTFTPLAFAFRVLVLGGVAATAANLAKSRLRAKNRLIRAMGDIERTIATNSDTASIFRVILEKTMKVTDCELSAIQLQDGFKLAAADWTAEKGDPERARDLLAAHYDEVLRLPSPGVLALHSHPGWTQQFALRPKPVEQWSGRLVRLEFENHVLGVLGIFSTHGAHYTADVQGTVTGLAPLVALAQRNAQGNRELKARLTMLHDIGEGLRKETSLPELFNAVVRLVAERVNSEEAALFLADPPEAEVEGQPVGIEKVAVAGPDEATRVRLFGLERRYQGNSGLTYGVFADKTPCKTNTIDPKERHAEAYRCELPSRKVLHYMGAPLFIGNEKLGVIRVLNKKAADYLVDKPSLDAVGFLDEDLELLGTIATQIVSAIRNGQFIERNQFFEKLLYESPDPMFVLDARGRRIRYFNEAFERAIGRTPQEIQKLPIAELFESKGDVREIRRALLLSVDRTIQEYETRIRNADGQLIPVLLSATLIMDASGHVTSSFGVFRDQREKQRQDEERRNAEKLAAVGKLAHAVGHDIKTDLGSLTNVEDVLRQRAKGNPELLQLADLIRASTAAALLKLQNILATAQPVALPPRKSTYLLPFVLSAFEASVKLRATISRITFTYQVLRRGDDRVGRSRSAAPGAGQPVRQLRGCDQAGAARPPQRGQDQSGRHDRGKVRHADLDR